MKAVRFTFGALAGLVACGFMVLCVVAYADAQFRGADGAQYSDAVASMRFFGFIAALSLVICVTLLVRRKRTD